MARTRQQAYRALRDGQMTGSQAFIFTSCLFFFSEKTKNLLFNGAKAVMGKIWTGEEMSTEPQPTGQAETPAGHALLRGQTLIGHDGRLMRANTAQGQSQVPFKRITAKVF